MTWSRRRQFNNLCCTTDQHHITHESVKPHWQQAPNSFAIVPTALAFLLSLSYCLLSLALALCPALSPAGPCFFARIIFLNSSLVRAG